MRYLKLYENFDEIDRICQQYNIQNYVINQDGSVDVSNGVYLHSMGLSKLPFKFGRVSDDFVCSHNQLTSLFGSPKEVGGNFACHYNLLTTLIGGPYSVGGNFICDSNNLKDMYGFPLYINNTFRLRLFNNPVSEIVGLVSIDKKITFVKWLNEYDVIRDGNKIVEMRLEEAYYMTTKTELPKNKRTFKNYQLI